MVPAYIDVFSSAAFRLGISRRRAWWAIQAQWLNADVALDGEDVYPDVSIYLYFQVMVDEAVAAAVANTAACLVSWSSSSGRRARAVFLYVPGTTLPPG